MSGGPAGDASGKAMPAPPSPRIAALGRRLAWGLAVFVFAWGLATFDRESLAWGAGGLVLHTLPLALRFTRFVTLRNWALWLGLFLVAQSLLSLWVENPYHTLPPNLTINMDVRTREIPGIEPGLRRITTDGKGFRVEPPVDYAQKQGLRVFAIGGSTTEEIFIDDRSTWTRLLQENLKQAGVPAQVINTGLSGLRAENHLATLERVAKLGPDLAVILLGANDWNKLIKDRFEPDRQRLKLPILRETLLGKAAIGLVIYPLKTRLSGKSPEDRDRVVDGRNGYVSAARRNSLERPVRHSFRPDAVAQDYRDTLVRIGEACRRLGIACVFVTQPHGYREQASPEFRAGFWMTPPYANYTLDLASMTHVADLYNRHLVEFARGNGHAVCDIAARFEPSYEVFYDDMHFTERGARRVAELLAPCVLEAARAKR